MNLEQEHAHARQRLDDAIAAGEPYVFGEDMLYALHLAGQLPQWPMLSRVIIDIQVGEPVTMYVQQIPTSALLSVAMEGDGLRVIVAEWPPPPPGEGPNLPTWGYTSTMCVCGDNQRTAELGAANVFVSHQNLKTGQPCPGIPR